MLRVSNLAQFQFNMSHVLRTQAKLAETQIQIASGKKAQSYSQIADQARQLVSLERARAHSAQFSENIDGAVARLNVMDSSLGAMTDRAVELKGLLGQALSGDNLDDVPLQDLAATFSAEIESLLNTQFGGAYIFAGARSDSPAVDLGDPDYAPQTGLPGGFAADAGYYQGDDFIRSVRADDDFELAYGVTADAAPFEQLLRALSYMDYAGTNGDPEVLEEAFTLVAGAIEGLSDLRSAAGSKSQSLERAKESHANFETFAANLVSEIEDVDIAQATTELAFNEVQLQGSFLALSRLQSLSLLEYLA